MISEGILYFYLPFILAGIAVIIWLNPKIKLIKRFKNNSQILIVFDLITILTIAIPTIFMQNYLSSVFGALTVLEYVDQISTFKKTKYYSIKNYIIDTKNRGVYFDQSVSGRGARDLTFKLYVAIPIINKAEIPSKEPLWLGYYYYKSLSNNSSEQHKEMEFKKFINNSFKRLNSEAFLPFLYFERWDQFPQFNPLIEAVKKSSGYRIQKPTILKPSVEPFEERTGNTLYNMFTLFLILGGFWFLIVLRSQFDENEPEQFYSNKREIR